MDLPKASWRGLDLKQKAQVLFAWSHQNILMPAEFRVLANLVHRQHPESAQCNPGVARIMKDTGYSERQVRAAIAGLKKKGVITAHQEDPQSTNNYTLFTVEHYIENAARLGLIVVRNGKQVQFHAPKPAGNCRADLQNSAPKKEIKKNLEMEDPEKSIVSGYTASEKRRDYEARLTQGFQKKGFCYEDYLNLPLELHLRVWQSYELCEITFAEALRLHLEAHCPSG
jgi:hypothetical protein